MAKSLRILFVEDQPLDQELILRELHRGGYEVTSERVETPDGFAASIDGRTWDVILCDYTMPRFSALAALAILEARNVDVPFIIISGVVGEESAVEALHAGAHDFIAKNRLARLLPAMERELAQAAERADRVALEAKAEADARRYTAELERSNAELEQFAYVASHDLQEPLRMVASYTELLAQRYRGQLDESADKFIRYAVEGAQRMQRMINELLNFSRVGAQRRPTRPVDSGAVLGRVIDGLGAAIAEMAAVVTAGELPSVYVDESQLGRLFQNLITNALKFRGVEPPRIVVSATRDASAWRFAIQDNGIGIEAQYADRIFLMFQRLHQRGTYEGSGFGLAIAKRIVEHHGGSIWFESEVGSGTTFYFTVPDTEAGTL